MVCSPVSNWVLIPIWNFISLAFIVYLPIGILVCSASPIKFSLQHPSVSLASISKPFQTLQMCFKPHGQVCSQQWTFSQYQFSVLALLLLGKNTQHSNLKEAYSFSAFSLCLARFKAAVGEPAKESSSCHGNQERKGRSREKDMHSKGMLPVTNLFQQVPSSAGECFNLSHINYMLEYCGSQ